MRATYSGSTYPCKATGGFAQARHLMTKIHEQIPDKTTKSVQILWSIQPKPGFINWVVCSLPAGTFGLGGQESARRWEGVRAFCVCTAQLQGGQLTFEGFFQMPDFHKGVLSSLSLPEIHCCPKATSYYCRILAFPPRCSNTSNNRRCFDTLSFLKLAAFASRI